jgi:hypothetical protein
MEVMVSFTMHRLVQTAAQRWLEIHDEKPFWEQKATYATVQKF